MKLTVAIACAQAIVLIASCRSGETGDSPASGVLAEAETVAKTRPAADEPPDPLDECQALLDRAVDLGSTDPAAGLEVLDQADQRLHDCTYTANQVYWLEMHAELKKARAELTKALQEDRLRRGASPVR